MRHYDLAVIGSGSGNTLVTDDWDEQSVVIVEAELFGGTCLNTGCIPTKMNVYAAEVAFSAAHAAEFGIDAHVDAVRWNDVRDRIFDRIDATSSSGAANRERSANLTVLRGGASFTGERMVQVATADGPVSFTATQIVIATGSRPVIPDVVTSSGVHYETSNSVMRIAALPASMVILGGGYIAAEFAHVFGSLGVEVRIVTNESALLTAQDSAISAAFTTIATGRWAVHFSAEVTGVDQQGEEVVVHLGDGSSVAGEILLVATGREPNSDTLDVAVGGVALREDGRVHVDAYGRTTAAGVWALGDVSSAFQLKHVANAEARTVNHNLRATTTGGPLRPMPDRAVPSAVFTHPQIATVGPTEKALTEAGRPFLTATKQVGDVAFGWAMEDTSGFCRLYGDPETQQLLGAHLMGPQAATLIQPLIGALAFGCSVPEFAHNQYWIHPAVTEVVEGALLDLAGQMAAAGRPGTALSDG